MWRPLIPAGGLPSHVLQGRSAAHKIPRFCLPGNVLASSSFLKVSLAEYEILGWHAFLSYRTAPSAASRPAHLCWQSRCGSLPLCFQEPHSAPTSDSLITGKAADTSAVTLSVSLGVSSGPSYAVFVKPVVFTYHIFPQTWSVVSHYFFRYSVSPRPPVPLGAASQGKHTPHLCVGLSRTSRSVPSSQPPTLLSPQAPATAPLA